MMKDRTEQFALVCLGIIHGVTVMSLIAMTYVDPSVETVRMEIKATECEFK